MNFSNFKNSTENQNFNFIRSDFLELSKCREQFKNENFAEIRKNNTVIYFLQVNHNNFSVIFEIKSLENTKIYLKYSGSGIFSNFLFWKV